jgi:hypothetical protein
VVAAVAVTVAVNSAQIVRWRADRQHSVTKAEERNGPAVLRIARDRSACLPDRRRGDSDPEQGQAPDACSSPLLLLAPSPAAPRPCRGPMPPPGQGIGCLARRLPCNVSRPR